jgi:transmembrane sensor
MDHLSENTIPWQLISGALQGELSEEETIAFQQWLASGAQNRELYEQVQNTWNNDLDELAAYMQADEAAGWNALRGKLTAPGTGLEDGYVTPVAGIRKRRTRLFSIISVAALLVLITGIFIWNRKTGSNNYNTNNTEQQKVALADGTLVTLFPASSMEVPVNYNESVRTVILKKGEAFFVVRHQEDKPFVVDMGIATVKDVGTSFHIKKTGDSIHIVVVDGKVAFRNNTSNEVRLLTAGMQATLLPNAGHASSLIVSDKAAPASRNQLRFINTSLTEVIQKLEVAYNMQIKLDSAIASKRFTGNLEGQSFKDAMNVLCQSLNIRLAHEKDGYYLKEE